MKSTAQLLNGYTNNNKKEVVVDPLCWQQGIIGAARAWVGDCLVGHKLVVVPHHDLLERLVALFTKTSPEVCDRTVAELERAGFMVGYEKRVSRVVISSQGFTLTTSANDTLNS